MSTETACLGSQQGLTVLGLRGLPILGGTEEEQYLRDLPRESGLVSAKAFKDAVVKIGQTQKAGRQLPRIRS